MRAVMRKEKKFLCDIASARQLQGLLGRCFSPTLTTARAATR